ncbi:hypothetical protein [Paracidovorax sp. MALMAid1276]|uniref:hypothetical protein n=1 Tax=Paracidovorax sp. MALMAid1276 TaxID=3411631 RepID=UPI003B9DA2A2
MQEIAITPPSTRTSLEKYLPYGVWIFFAYSIFQYAAIINNGGNSWITGDWLINYSAGPIRRGLIGELILSLSSEKIPALWIAYTIQTFFYLATFLLVFAIYKIRDRSAFWLLILFSPAFLLFSFYDTQGSFRKEIMIFAIYSFLCLLYCKKNVTPPKLILISIAYLIAAFSHELNALTWPFFAYIIYNSAKEGLISQRTATIFSLALIFLSAAVLLFASLNKGTAKSADLICLSLIKNSISPSICDGAINWLKEDTKTATNTVKSLISQKSLWTPILFILAIAPLLFTTWIRKETFLLLIVSTITISPLFFVAVDYGRWVYILVFLIFCTALSENIQTKLPKKRIFYILGMIYLTTWSIPHCCMGSEVGGGLIGYIKKM